MPRKSLKQKLLTIPSKEDLAVKEVRDADRTKAEISTRPMDQRVFRLLQAKNC